MTRIRTDIELGPADTIAVHQRTHADGCIIALGSEAMVLLTPAAEDQLRTLLNVREGRRTKVVRLRPA